MLMNNGFSPRYFENPPNNFVPIQTIKTNSSMDAIVNLLTPEQVDAILAAYDSVAAWYAQAADYISTTANSLVIEDVWL